jgi:hypothetical protein
LARASSRSARASAALRSTASRRARSSASPAASACSARAACRTGLQERGCRKRCCPWSVRPCVRA